VTNLLELDASGLAALLAQLGEKAFRAKQVSRWIHQRLSGEIAAMTDLSKSLRERLAGVAEIRGPAVISDTTADDGTRKWLLDVGGGNAVEMVYIPEDDRGTLCISSQAGCALDCAFCSTGKQGFNRNLTTAEIVGQLWHANRALLADGVSAAWIEQGRAPITNVVMMGMGEPLENYDAVLEALTILSDPSGMAVPAKRITISTVGLAPQIIRLADQGHKFRLAVSLHAATDLLRSKLMPVNQRFPLEQLMRAVHHHVERTGRRVTFEYILLEELNDSIADAAKLVRLVAQLPCKINLIPYNPIGPGRFKRPSAERIERFADYLRPRVPAVTVRYSQGVEIGAACGQLAGEAESAP
jgi:23S rRNA (adenine2503-C2)-methyltransferase